MATLPVICKGCGNAVSVDTERNMIKCPHCGSGLSIVKALQDQHPEWVKLIEEEKKLVSERNEAVPGLNEYEKKPSEFNRYIPVFVAVGVTTLYLIVRTIQRGFQTPQSVGEVIVYIVLFIFFVLVLGLPLFLPYYKKHQENEDKKAYSEITTDRVCKRLLEISQEKQDYLRKFGE